MQDVQTVFIILEENHSWASIKGSALAPYVNNTLLPMASYAEQYYTPPGVGPSLPNYLWLEAGTDFGVSDNGDPSQNHQSTAAHLVRLLDNAGISWTSYQEDISGTVCPLASVGHYAPKHNPMVYFDDVTGMNNANSAYCITHIRPFSELAGDLQPNAVARYNFITPNLCNDMHGGGGCPAGDDITRGDAWLSTTIPMIMNSEAYRNNGAIFITWDEDSGTPIGMIVLSSQAKGGGYHNSIHYTHSSTLRTMQEIFGVGPMLRDAANATDLGDLFRPAAPYPPGDVNGDFHLDASDSLLINQVLVGLRSSNDSIFQLTGFLNGDVNQEGQVTSADSLLINQQVVGLRSFIVTKVVPNVGSNPVPTPVTIFGIGFPAAAVTGASIGPPVNMNLSNVTVISPEVITAVVPAGGGVGTGTVNVEATPANGVISFGRFTNQ